MACKLDTHPRRQEIDNMLVAGTPIRTICAMFNASTGTVHRHKECIRELLSQAITQGRAERATQGSDLLDRVHRLADEAVEILATARSEQNLKAATAAICAAVRCLELCGRLDGSLAQPNSPGLHLHLSKTVNVTNNYGDDADFAQMVGEATRGFDVGELMRLKAIAESAILQP